MGWNATFAMVAQPQVGPRIGLAALALVAGVSLWGEWAAMAGTPDRGVHDGGGHPGRMSPEAAAACAFAFDPPHHRCDAPHP